MLYDRFTSLIIDGKEYNSDSISIDFRVEFERTDEPIIQEIFVYNLSDDSLKRVRRGSNIILNAGYRGNTGTIVIGNVLRYSKRYVGVDIELKLEIVSNIDRWNNLIVSKSYEAGTRASKIIRDLLADFGIEIGDLNLVNDIRYTRQKVLEGTLKNALQEITRDAQSRLYFINNVIYITPPYSGEQKAIVLNAESGLIGSPEQIEVEGQEGFAVECLLNHRINVNSAIRIESRFLKGNFIVVNGVHTGDYITSLEVLPL